MLIHFWMTDVTYFVGLVSRVWSSDAGGTGMVRTSENGVLSVMVAVMLNTRPYHPVDVPVVSSDESEGKATVSVLHFNSSNWHMEQKFAVEGVDDKQVDYDVNY